jgi:hypothetical protein
LGCDLAGCGELFPEAKHKADEIMEKYFNSNRTRLLDIYAQGRAQFDSELREVFKRAKLEEQDGAAANGGNPSA